MYALPLALCKGVLLSFVAVLTARRFVNDCFRNGDIVVPGCDMEHTPSLFVGLDDAELLDERAMIPGQSLPFSNHARLQAMLSAIKACHTGKRLRFGKLKF
jgi:hypothetical protein